MNSTYREKCEADPEIWVGLMMSINGGRLNVPKTQHGSTLVVHWCDVEEAELLSLRRKKIWYCSGAHVYYKQIRW